MVEGGSIIEKNSIWESLSVISVYCISVYKDDLGTGWHRISVKGGWVIWIWFVWFQLLEVVLPGVVVAVVCVVVPEVAAMVANATTRAHHSNNSSNRLLPCDRSNAHRKQETMTQRNKEETNSDIEYTSDPSTATDARMCIHRNGLINRRRGWEVQTVNIIDWHLRIAWKKLWI